MLDRFSQEYESQVHEKSVSPTAHYIEMQNLNRTLSKMQKENQPYKRPHMDDNELLQQTPKEFYRIHIR